MLVTLNTSEIEKLIKDNIDTPREYDVKSVVVFYDNEVDYGEDAIKAEVVMEKEEL